MVLEVRSHDPGRPSASLQGDMYVYVVVRMVGWLLMFSIGFVCMKAYTCVYIGHKNEDSSH